MRTPLIAAALAAGPLGAQTLELVLPLDCELGDTCYIQRYVDRDPGPGAVDFMCGDLVGDGHRGTDIALPSLAAMEAGVDVLAAAPGTVGGIRDGMPDVSADDPGATPYGNRNCGNGVVITHAGGWETQYCHLKRGSVTVAPGDEVSAGDVLGEVGLSGETTFPHVHLSVRRDGEVVDPFAPDGTGCETASGTALWADPPEYQPGGLIAVGFADGIPEFDAIEAGTETRSALPADAPALVVWAYLFGGRAEDVVRLSIAGPEGDVIAEDVVLERAQPQLFRAVGRRTPDGGWPAGAYEASAILLRDGAEVDRRGARITLVR